MLYLFKKKNEITLIAQNKRVYLLFEFTILNPRRQFNLRVEHNPNTVLRTVLKLKSYTGFLETLPGSSYMKVRGMIRSPPGP